LTNIEGAYEIIKRTIDKKKGNPLTSILSPEGRGGLEKVLSPEGRR